MNADPRLFWQACVLALAVGYAVRYAWIPTVSLTWQLLIGPLLRTRRSGPEFASDPKEFWYVPETGASPILRRADIKHNTTAPPLLLAGGIVAVLLSTGGTTLHRAVMYNFHFAFYISLIYRLKFAGRGRITMGQLAHDIVKWSGVYVSLLAAAQAVALLFA